jgi:hypothetical protein
MSASRDSKVFLNRPKIFDFVLCVGKRPAHAHNGGNALREPDRQPSGCATGPPGAVGHSKNPVLKVHENGIFTLGAAATRPHHCTDTCRLLELKERQPILVSEVFFDFLISG